MSSWADMFNKASSLEQIGVVDDDEHSPTTETEDHGIGSVAELAASFRKAQDAVACSQDATKKRKLSDAEEICHGTSAVLVDATKAQDEKNLESFAQKKKRKKKKKRARSKIVDQVGDPMESVGKGKLREVSSSKHKQLTCDETVDGKSAKPDFPFPVEEDDHCESPLEAYTHVAPLIRRLAVKLGKSPDELRIYDPYYCDGSVSEKLSNLGFNNVINEKKDCYTIWKNSSAIPDFDMVVTNPPYSGDHMKKMMKFLTNHVSMKGKPWMVLAPQFLIKKDYYSDSFEGRNNDIRAFFLVPHKRYVYAPPKGFRGKRKSDTHKKSSPFISMWFIWGGSSIFTNDLTHYFQKQTSGKKDNHTHSRLDAGRDNNYVSSMMEVDLARSKSHLRDLRRIVKKRNK